MYKRVWSDQETESRNEGGGATLSEAAREYFGAKWRLAYCYQEWSVDSKNILHDISITFFIVNNVEYL